LAPQRITAEHSRLSALFEETRAALLGGDGRQVARAALGRFVEAVETHLVQEESLYYPTIWALRPEFKLPLLGLIGSHPALRLLLAAIAQALDAEGLDDAKRRFDQFVDSYSRHEEAEEELLLTLDQAIAIAPC
jgi:hemerythrin superfamily protein